MEDLFLLPDLLNLIWYIGAFTRWSLSGFRGKLRKRIEEDNAIVDFVIGLVVVILIIVAIAVLVR